MLSGLLAVVLAWQGVSSLTARYHFGINETESLPNWAFITDRQVRRHHRGQLVAFVAPDNRFYPHGSQFVKIVAGVPGDRVEARGRDFYINGKFVGTAKTHSRDGAPVEMGPTGTIPAGRYFVVTSHKDSLDSRYQVIGWIGQERIIGTARAVL